MKRIPFVSVFVLLIFCAGLLSCEDPVIPERRPSGNPPDNPPSPSTSITFEQFKQKYMTYADEIAIMRINTNGREVTSGDDYINATISIEGTRNYNRSNWPVEIRRRGNSTFDMPKRSYRIKANSKTSIFGRPAVKNWALIANYADKSLMRNYVASMLGRSLTSMSFNPNVIFLEVYFNGNYEGLYGMQDQMEAKPSRVDVEYFIKDKNGNLSDVGFLLEVDWPDRNPDAVKGRDYFTLEGNISCYLKYPKYDDDGFENPAFFRQAFNYIENYMIDVDNAIRAKNKTAFERLCVKDSFIDFNIVQEMSKDVDGAHLSIFFNRKPGGKLEMGPLWDFDIAFGNADYNDHPSPPALPEGWYVISHFGWDQLSWFRSLMQTNDFYESFRSRYIELYRTNIQYTIDCIDLVRGLIRPAALRNFDRWNILNEYVWPNPPGVMAKKTWDGQVDYLKDFWTRRSNWMYNQLYNRRPIPDVR